MRKLFFSLLALFISAGSSAFNIYTEEPQAISADTYENSSIDIWQQMPKTFTFASGAGGWRTFFDLNPDGTFSGEYTDYNLGDTGNGYPNGSVYISKFTGKFTAPIQLDKYTYSMKLDYIKTAGTPGDIYYENETRYICSEPYGFDDADEFMIYLPGSPCADLPEEFLDWAHLSGSTRSKIPSDIYGIHNVNGKEGFIGYTADCLWNSEFKYSYGNTSSVLSPNGIGMSRLTFRAPGADYSPWLTFYWSEDEQTEFIATEFVEPDTYGPSAYQYKISIHVSNDKSKATVTVISLEGNDLSLYGGTADGKLTAEYHRSE